MELICLGDSLTFGYGVRPSQRFTYLTAQATEYKVTNLGQCGDTAGGMLLRLHSQILTERGAKSLPRIMLMGGVNDIFYTGTDSTARADMGAMIHLLLSLGTVPIVGIPMKMCGTIPEAWSAIADPAALAGVFDSYYNWLESFCRAFSVNYIDFRPDFLSADGSVLTSLYLDGIHPNAKGHALMAKRLTAFLTEKK